MPNSNLYTARADRVTGHSLATITLNWMIISQFSAIVASTGLARLRGLGSGPKPFECQSSLPAIEASSSSDNSTMLLRKFPHNTHTHTLGESNLEGPATINQPTKLTQAPQPACSMCASRATTRAGSCRLLPTAGFAAHCCPCLGGCCSAMAPRCFDHSYRGPPAAAPS